MNIPVITLPSVTLSDDLACTTCREISRVFGTPHGRILESIAAVSACLPDENLALFFMPAKSVVVDKGITTVRRSPMFHVTKAGFILLAKTCFFGEWALAWKLAFLEAFHRFDAALLMDDEIAGGASSLLRPRWLVYFDEEGHPCMRVLPNEAGIITRNNIREIVRECYPEFELIEKGPVVAAAGSSL